MAKSDKNKTENMKKHRSDTKHEATEKTTSGKVNKTKNQNAKALKLQRIKKLLEEKKIKEKKDISKGSTDSGDKRLTSRSQPKNTNTASGGTGQMSALQQKMQQKLKGARFRWINEMLYTTTGDAAFKMLQDDPKIFSEYHEGFTSQVEKWPTNPVDVLIKYLQQQDKLLVVADMGCGEAKLAREMSFAHTIHSFDLVKHNKFITPCNIANVPLDDGVCDVVIFCLALMGTDFLKFIKEANRILKPGGEMKIAEVVSRIDNIDSFVDELKTLGFQLKHKDSSNKMFIMFDFIKCENCPKTKKTTKSKKSALLKPCIYKRR